MIIRTSIFISRKSAQRYFSLRDLQEKLDDGSITINPYPPTVYKYGDESRKVVSTRIIDKCRWEITI